MIVLSETKPLKMNIKMKDSDGEVIEVKAGEVVKYTKLSYNDFDIYHRIIKIINGKQFSWIRHKYLIDGKEYDRLPECGG